jgi:hypothetical protein
MQVSLQQLNDRVEKLEKGKWLYEMSS